MVSKDNSAINCSQCRIFKRHPPITHRHSPSLTVTYRTHRHACYCDFAAAYAVHGYSTWLRHMWLRRLRHIWLRQTRLRHMVMPHVVMSVTPRLRQTRLRHMVMPHVVTPVTPNSVTSHGYTTRAGGEKC